MERTTKKGNSIFFLSFASLAIFILLATSFTAAAQASNSKTPLPYYLVRYAEHMSRGNATYYATIINEMITQEQIKKQMIESSNGSVLEPPQASPLTSGNSYMASLYSVSPDTIDQVTHQVVGSVGNIYGIVGTNNGDYSHLFTDGWDEVQRNPAIGGEAFESGHVYGTYATGNFYITAYTDQPSWQKYVMVTVTNTPSNYDSWQYVGSHAVVTSWNSPSTYYVGYIPTNQHFTYVAVECWTPPPYPIPYSPLILNSVYVDSVRMYW